MTENIRRVVITGLGIVSPVGSTVNKAWDNIKNGVSGIRKINSFDASSFSVQIAGSVIDFNAEDFITPKDQKKMDTFIHYGIGASAMAIKDAGLEINDQNRDRIGISIGSGIGDGIAVFARLFCWDCMSRTSGSSSGSPELAMH